MENNLQEKEAEIVNVDTENVVDGFEGEKKANKNRWILIIIIFLIVLILTSAGFFYRSGIAIPGIGKEKRESSVTTEGDGCSAEYGKLLSTHKLDESLCAQKEIRSGEFKEAEIKKTKTNVILIFDSSGSMAAKIDDKTKIDIAKTATNKFIENIKTSGSNLSLLLYGHKGSNSLRDKAASCAGIDEVYWLDVVKPEIVREKFNSAKPTGWTPIAKSLEMAKDIIIRKTAKGDKNIILLVSDGEETCNGNPIETTRGIKAAGLDIKVNVIGFDVGGATEDQLRKIAEAGDGQYYSVKNEKDFETIFQEQENMLNKMDFVVNGGVERLYDVSSSILKYNQCVMMLNLEEAGFMLNIEKEISSNCKSYAEEKYFSRYDEMKNRFANDFEGEKSIFNRN